MKAFLIPSLFGALTLAPFAASAQTSTYVDQVNAGQGGSGVLSVRTSSTDGESGEETIVPLDLLGFASPAGLGGNNAAIEQSGDGNISTINQTGRGNTADSLITGSFNRTTQTQTGNNNSSAISIGNGNRNVVRTTQAGDGLQSIVDLRNTNGTSVTHEQGPGAGTITTRHTGEATTINIRR